MELNGGEYRSSAPFTIQDSNGGANFKITQSSINANTVVAYPNLYVGCHGTCTRNNPFPLQLSSIKPGEVTTSVTSVTPSSATGTWGDFYDIYITAGAHQSPTTMPREELTIWLDQHNRGHGSPVARGVRLDGRVYDVYKPNTPGGGTHAYIPQTMNDSFNGDLLPFIQDSIRRGYAKPNWYLIVVEHGFEITQGNVMGLGDSSFSVK
jgi:cellulose 1,4-beta-cellobiosidase